MLIAAEKGARLIVSVGSQFNLVEFLDRNREGMSSTFLTRLRIGEILVDAKGVSRLYQPRPGLTPLLVVIARRADRDDRGGLDDAGAARRRGTAVAEAPDAGRAPSARPRRLTRCPRPAPMFDFRYHALSLAAVLFALALGVAARRGDRRLQPRLLRQERHRPRPQIGSQPGAPAAPDSCRPGSADEEAFANGLYPLAVHELLAGRTIGLVFLGGSSDQIDALVRDGRRARPAATSRPWSRCASRSNSKRIAHEAAGTHYATLAGSTQLRRTASAISSAASSSAAGAGRPRADQPRAREPAERLRRAAHAPGRACGRARRAERHERRTERSQRRVRVGPARRRRCRRRAAVGVELEQHRTVADPVVQGQGHLQRRRPRQPRRTGRARYALAGDRGTFGVKSTADSLLPSVSTSTCPALTGRAPEPRPPAPLASSHARPAVRRSRCVMRRDRSRRRCCARCSEAGHTRPNYRGRALPFPFGVLTLAAALIALIPLTLVERLASTQVLPSRDRSRSPCTRSACSRWGCSTTRSRRTRRRRAPAWARGRQRGWRGHGAAALRGELSTGALKAAGSLGLALLAMSYLGLSNGRWLLAAGGARARDQRVQPARPAPGARDEGVRAARRRADDRLGRPAPAVGARPVRRAGARRRRLRPA